MPYGSCWGHPGMLILYTSKPGSSDSCKKHYLTTYFGAVQAGWKTFKMWFGMDIGSNK